jgi:hypothetical protein
MKDISMEMSLMMIKEYLEMAKKKEKTKYKKINHNILIKMMLKMIFLLMLERIRK